MREIFFSFFFDMQKRKVTQTKLCLLFRSVLNEYLQATINCVYINIMKQKKSERYFILRIS